MEIKTKLGLRIKAIREIPGMSQKDLAYSADLDRSYIASVESVIPWIHMIVLLNN